MLRSPIRAAVAALVLATGASVAPSPFVSAAAAADAPPAGVEAKDWSAWTRAVDEWFAAADDAARVAVEQRAAAVEVPEAAVGPLAERMFDLASKTGPKLRRTGRGWFYDEKTKKGLYIVGPSARKPCGLLIALHGGGEGQGDAGSAFGQFGGATSQGFTVIAPEVMAKVSSAWNEQAEERFVLDLIDAAKRTFPVDPDRICIAGHSMGGDGSWMIGGRNADLFAAASPLAGSVMPYMRPGTNNKRRTPRDAYLGLMEGVLPNLLHLPYWVFHSADDENEAIHPDDIATERLRTLQSKRPGKYELVYDRIDGNGHALPPKGVGPIVEWLAGKTRVTYPQEVVWETWWPWKRQMYWLAHPSPLEAWRFRARVSGPNAVEVSATTKPLPGRDNPKAVDLTILASPKMFDLTKPIRVTSAGAVLAEAMPKRTLGVLLATVARRNDRSQWFEASVTVSVPRTQWKDAWEEP